MQAHNREAILEGKSGQAWQDEEVRVECRNPKVEERIAFEISKFWKL